MQHQLKSRRRASIGEMPERVKCVGAIGLDYLKDKLLTLKALNRQSILNWVRNFL